MFRTSKLDELVLNENVKVKSNQELETEIATQILKEDIGGSR